MNQIEAVIFDWAGTTVDYGCIAPLEAMRQAFLQREVIVSLEEIRKPMGMAKREHIKTVLAAHKHNEEDIKAIYANFEKNILLNLHQFSDLIPGILPVQAYLREQSIKIGTTTGYTREMIDIVAGCARKKGYTPDCIVTPDQVTRGRPYPYMLQQNLWQLDIQDVRKVIKVGDTVVDIQEGLHAGCWSIGVVKGSSMLGFRENEIAATNVEELKERTNQITDEMRAAGAHFVLDSIAELPAVIEMIRTGEECALMN